MKFLERLWEGIMFIANVIGFMVIGTLLFSAATGNIKYNDDNKTIIYINYGLEP